MEAVRSVDDFFSFEGFVFVFDLGLDVEVWLKEALDGSCHFFEEDGGDMPNSECGVMNCDFILSLPMPSSEDLS